MNIDELIWKLIDVSDIKRDYQTDLIAEYDEEIINIDRNINWSKSPVHENILKLEKRIQQLDEEFLKTLEEIKREADIVTILELDKNKYAKLRDLKYAVEENIKLESKIEDKRREVKALKRRLGNGAKKYNFNMV